MSAVTAGRLQWDHAALWRPVPGRSRLDAPLAQVLHYPVQVVGDARVDARKARLTAAEAERYHAHDVPVGRDDAGHHHRAAAVPLPVETGVTLHCR